jgi:phosphoglycolate phosphatase
MRISNIIFDMDGTLIDTAKATVEACRKAAESRGFPPLTIEVLKAAMGIPGLDYYRKVLPGMEDGALREFALAADTEENNLLRFLGKKLLFDEIEKVLIELSRAGYGLFIASTGSREHVDTALAAADIRKYFTAVYCGEPNKAETIKGIPELSNPKEWLMVGDKRIDADAARKNSIFSIGAAFGYCGTDEQKFFDKVVSRPGEIIEFVKGK